MPFTVRTRIDGLKPLLAKLDGLKRAIQRKAIKDAVDAAGKLVLDAVKPLVPTDTQLLKKSMGRKVKVYRSNGVAVAIVGPRTGFKVQSAAARASGKSLVGSAINSKTGKIRKVILRQGAGRGPVGHNPTQYAHLAERGRKAVKAAKGKALSSGAYVFASARAARGSRFMERGLAAARGRIVPTMAAAIQAALTKAGR